MITNLSYRQKNYALLAGFCILVWLIYFLAIKNTLIEVDAYRYNLLQIEQGNTAHERISDYKQKLKYYEKHLGAFSTSSGESHEKILDAISVYCNQKGLTIETYPAVQSDSYGDFILNTHQIEVRGNFKELLTLVYYLETKEKLGRLASVKFEKKEDRKTRKTILTASIYLQTTSL